MKKALLASTAIVTAAALASPAAAADRVKLGLGGYMEQYVGFIQQEDGDKLASGQELRDFKVFDEQSDSEVYFSGSTTLDNGIKLALRVELEGDAGAATIDESWLDIQTAWGTLRLGADDPVSDLMSVEPRRGILNDYNNWVPAVGGNTIATANTNSNVTVDDPYGVRTASDDNGVYYVSPKIAGFQTAVSYQPEMGSGGANGTPNSVTDAGSALSATLNWAGEVGPVAISTGYAYLHEESAVPGAAGNFVSHNVGLNVSYAGIGLGVAYGRWLEKDSVTTTAAANTQAGSSSVDGHMYVVGLWYISGPIEVGYNHKFQTVQGQTINAANIGGNGNDENTLDGAYFNYQISDGVKWESMVFHVDYDDELSLDAASHSGGWGVVGGLRLDF